MADGFNFFLHRAAKAAGEVVPVSGGSGYFSRPESNLDPRLFVGDRIDPSVRQFILSTLYTFWERRFNQPKRWSNVWLAGSGITYQWAANRSNGDLDVLIGVNFPEFFRLNPDYVGFSEEDMADMFNHAFKEELWPRTAAVTFPSNAEAIPGAFEVTYYVNPRSADIRSINPYAAYDLTHESWTVRPPELPENPETIHPQEYWESVEKEDQDFQRILDEYNMNLHRADREIPGTPQHTNAVSALGRAADQARALFDDIHLGRKQAFGPGGKGYGDYYNFRWQVHKRSGKMQALAAIAKARGAAREEQETSLYGHPLLNSREVLTQAALSSMRYGR